MRYSGAAALVLLSGLGVGADFADGAALPSFEVSTSLPPSPTVSLGDTFDIQIMALVVNSSPDNGIALFDQNFVIDQAVSGAPSPFKVLDITTPGVDVLLGNADGTDSYDSTSGDYLGRVGIYGGYDATDVGINSPVTLYDVELQAVGLGSATFTSGPSEIGYGPASPGDPAPDGIYLNDGSTPEGTYLLGPTVTVVPEPDSALVLGSIGIAVACLFRRRTSILGG